MSQQYKIGKVHTTVHSVENTSGGYDVVVTYHRTEVVRFDNNRIILKSGGWYTQTTRVRMNQASRQFNLGYQVFQKNYKWFVSYNGETLPFEESMVLIRTKE